MCRNERIEGAVCIDGLIPFADARDLGHGIGKAFEERHALWVHFIGE